MKDMYNETIERMGKTYYYDPDYDCYYCKYEPMNHWSKYNWIYVIAVLSAIRWLIEQ